MPVQKYEAPNNDSVYEPEGPRGARHTLFSGTEVLQAGAGGCTEVLAIVTATGNVTTISQPPYRLKKTSLHECSSIEFKNQSQGYRLTGHAFV
jgi:magnesium-transporting ATPase (P-type)